MRFHWLIMAYLTEKLVMIWRFDPRVCVRILYSCVEDCQTSFVDVLRTKAKSD